MPSLHLLHCLNYAAGVEVRIAEFGDSILNYSTTALDAKHHEGTTTSDVEIAIGGMTTFPVSSGS